MKKLFYVVLFFTLFLTAGSVTAFAQSAPLLPGPNITLNSNTPSPTPGQTVDLDVESFATDLNRATIVWYVNGKQVESGIGQTTYNVAMGSEGSTLTVTVDVSTQDGQVSEQSMTFRPASVDMIWQAKSFVPPFYEGKALFPYQGTVVVSAVPSFTTNSTNAVYTWSENGTVLGNQSGYGKDSVTVSQPLIATPMNITVQVSSLDNSMSAQNGIIIPAQSPQILFYANDPIYGIQYQNVLASEFTLGNNQIQLQAVPYFFDSSSPGDDSAVTYDWNINGSEVAAAQNDKNYLVLRTSGATGQAEVGLKVTNAAKILQFNTANLIISL